MFKSLFPKGSMILDIDYLIDNRKSGAISSMVRWPKDLEVLFISQWSIAAQKVGNFVKTTGAKVAKFGLKVVQSVGEVVGHAASFIPAIGKPIQAAIKGVTTVAGVASNSIHAKLSSKLQKGMNVMNKADKVMSYSRLCHNPSL